MIRDLDVFAQCYYRWMPIVDIRNGGFVQIYMYNRMILSNIHKLQKGLETGKVDDIQLDPKTVDDDEQNRVPVLNSFFPFSDGEDVNSNLHDILILSSDVLAEGFDFD